MTTNTKLKNLLRKKGQYEYTPLNELKIGSTVNVYGIILDAVTPHLSFRNSKKPGSTNKWICTLKIADNTSGFS